MNLDKETGISIMRIINELDAGPVSNNYKISISDNDNFLTLSEKLSSLASEKLLENIDDILEDKLAFYDQNNLEATYAKKILKSEGKINWNETGEKIIGKINGLNPFPGAWFIYNGERYKILKAELGNKKGNPGIVSNDNLEVFCKFNSLKIIEIQREGKKLQKINEFLLGSQIKQGSNLNNA
tara:strand:- start:389 stop:937 length:549 start_codon:yes stop_codon:yes gene_type:complete